jgi:hypothetical protein
MKISKIRKRLQPNRPMVTISMRVPSEVIADLKRVAPALGFSGYQPLIRAYVGQALRADLQRLEQQPTLEPLLKSLRKHGVPEQVISSAVADVKVLRRPA